MTDNLMPTLSNFDEPIYIAVRLEHTDALPTFEPWPTHEDFMRAHDFSNWLYDLLGRVRGVTAGGTGWPDEREKNRREIAAEIRRLTP